MDSKTTYHESNVDIQCHEAFEADQPTTCYGLTKELSPTTSSLKGRTCELIGDYHNTQEAIFIGWPQQVVGYKVQRLNSDKVKLLF